MMSMSLTAPSSRARDLKSSSSPALTVRYRICDSTMLRPSCISVSSVLAQYLPNRNSATYSGTGYLPLKDRARSLRTTYPSKACAARSSSSSKTSVTNL